MDFQRRLEENTVFREDRMSEFIQLSKVLDGLATDFGFLGLHFLAMALRIAEHPQLMKTVAYASSNMLDARTTTMIRQSIATEVLILKGEPVSGDEATDEINPVNGILGPT